MLVKVIKVYCFYVELQARYRSIKSLQQWNHSPTSLLYESVRPSYCSVHPCPQLYKTCSGWPKALAHGAPTNTQTSILTQPIKVRWTTRLKVILNYVVELQPEKLRAQYHHDQAKLTFSFELFISECLSQISKFQGVPLDLIDTRYIDNLACQRFLNLSDLFHISIDLSKFVKGRQYLARCLDELVCHHI